MAATAQFTLIDLRRTLSNARDYGEMWWLLDGEHPERDTIIEASEHYGAFFKSLLSGMFVAFIILLTSLFDEGSDCITLKSVPEFAADPAFAQLWSDGRVLYKYRSKAIAHRDDKNESVDFAKVTGFTWNQIRGILNGACGLYDRYAQAQFWVMLPPIKSRDELLLIIKKLVE